MHLQEQQNSSVAMTDFYYKYEKISVLLSVIKL